jgi:TolB-like protein
MRSPQLSKFLKHIVDAKLRGDEASIKAYSIAVDVFGRPATFDPQTDPIVRVQARRLRGLLQEFYRQNLGQSEARITLPVGRYVPEFEFLSGEDSETAVSDAGPAAPEADMAAAAAAPAAAPPVERFGRRFWLQAVAAMSLVVALGLLLAGLQILRAPQPQDVAPDPTVPIEPTVYISSFTNLSGIAGLDAFVSRLNDQLSSLLAQFEDVKVGFVEPGLQLDKRSGGYLLSGTIATIRNGMEITAVLTDATTGSAVWNRTIQQPLPSPDDDTVVATAARKIMREIGPFRSPVHAQGRRWLDDNTMQIPAVNGYVCLLTYRYAREFANPAAIAKALDCHERLRAQEPGQALALAAEAWLEGRVIYNGSSVGDRMDIALAEPMTLAEEAVKLAPESSFAHEQLAAVQNWTENYETAQRNYAIALGFEPLNTDARAGYAITLARVGDWQQAAQQAQFAIADTPNPAPWYYYLPSLIALRDGRYGQAIEDGRIAAQAGEIGALVALSAAGISGADQVIADFQPRVMSMESLRRIGIMPWLSIRIKDQDVLTRLADGLRAGGIPESALTAQF